MVFGSVDRGEIREREQSIRHLGSLEGLLG
jgi:hypothetical protein